MLSHYSTRIKPTVVIFGNRIHTRKLFEKYGMVENNLQTMFIASQLCW